MDTAGSAWGPKNAREAGKHFGPAPGVPHSDSKPYVRSKSRKFERARGRRKLSISCINHSSTEFYTNGSIHLFAVVVSL